MVLLLVWLALSLSHVCMAQVTNSWGVSFVDAGIPARRAVPAMVTSTNHSLYMTFGLLPGLAPAGDVWLFDTTSQRWEQEVNVPPNLNRFGHTTAAVSDSEAVVFGGLGSNDPTCTSCDSTSSCCFFLGDSWSLALGGPFNMSIIQTHHDSPEKLVRAFHTTVGINGCAVTFGGWGPSGVLNDVWVLKPGAKKWNLLTPTGGPPSPRRGHWAAKLSDGIMLMGGGCETTPVQDELGSCNDPLLEDVWMLTLASSCDSATWQSVKLTTPSKALFFGSPVHSAESRILIYSGSSRQLLSSSDIHQIDCDAKKVECSWSLSTPQALSPKPQARYGSAATWVPGVNSMLIFGGAEGFFQRVQDFPNVWGYDPEIHVWFQIKYLNAPLPRLSTSACLMHPNIYIFGGTRFSLEPLADTWSYNIGSGLWDPFQKQKGQPSPRRGASLTPLRDTCVLFGGLTGTTAIADSFFNDVYVMYPDQRTWTKVNFAVSAFDLPPPRNDHVAEPAGNQSIVIFGGVGSGSSQQGFDVLSDTYLLTCTKLHPQESVSCAWKFITPPTKPPPRGGAASSVLGSRLVVYGGFDSSFDPLGDLW